MPTTRIVLIRHGETAWNAERRLQGHIDIALNAQGVRQAEALADALAGERFDAIIASDLQRAHQTAQAVARRHGMQVSTDPFLRERCFGGFEGLLYAEIEARFPHQFKAWQARDIDARFPEGVFVAETLREFYDRAVNAIIRIVSEQKYHRVALRQNHRLAQRALYQRPEHESQDQWRSGVIVNPKQVAERSK